MSRKNSTASADLTSEEVLARASLARIDRYAIHVAAIICDPCKLSISGQRHLSKALNDLPLVDTADERLTFGWTADNQLRSRQVAETGFERLAIMTALAESFHKEYAAEVMHRLAILVMKDPALTPHKSQWRDLIRACNGVLAADEFSFLVEKYIRLDPFSSVPGGHSSSARSLVPAKSVAEAVLALSDVSEGKRKSVTVSGGAVIGWIAALAEHFFGMSISVFSSKDEHLHGLQSVGEAELILIFDEKSDLRIVDERLNGTDQAMNGLTINDLAFSTHMHFLPFGGRASWETLLPSVFGRSFQHLDHEYSKLMFVAIGCAFRGMEEVPDRTSGVKAEVSPISAAGLLKTLTAFLPGLQHGSGKMDRQLKLSAHHANETYSYNMQELRQVCQCGVCSNAQNPSTSYCLPCLVATIVDLGLILGRTILSQQISPSREGIQLIYNRRTSIEQSLHTETGTIIPSITATSFHEKLLRADTPTMLQTVVELFCGAQVEEQLPPQLVALAHEGICAFSAEIAGRTVRPGMRGVVRVLSGAINLQRKIYRRACLGRRPDGRDAWEWEEVPVAHLDDVLWCK